MYIPLLSVARGHPPPHCENTQVLREAITEDDDDDDLESWRTLVHTFCFDVEKSLFNRIWRVTKRFVLKTLPP